MAGSGALDSACASLIPRERSASSAASTRAPFLAALDALDEAVLSRDAADDLLGDPIAELVALGIGVSRLPRSAGGWGLTLSEHVQVMAAVAHAEPSAVQALRSHHVLVEQLLAAGEDAESARWLAEVRAGRIFAGATTEPHGGIVGEQATRLMPREGSWLLEGRKAYCTGAAYADWLRVLAVDPEGRRCTATVARRAPGVEVREERRTFGQRASASGTATFRQVVVADAEVRPAGTPGSLPQALRDAHLQLTHLTTLSGIAARIADDLIGWAEDNVRHFSHAAAPTPAEDPVVQQLVGTILARAAACRSLVGSCAVEVELAIGGTAEDVGSAHRSVTSAQVIIVDLVLASATQMFEAGGGSLVAEARGWDRHWRNARTLASHNPAVQKARSLGAEALLGEPLPEIWFGGRAEARS